MEREFKEFDISIGQNEIVTVTRMNHLTEIQYMEKMNTRQTIKKLSSDEYLNLDTGEIKRFEKTENRSEGVISLYKTFKKLRYLINNNFSGAKNELFITLTYAPDGSKWRPMLSDSDYLSKTCKAFQRKLKSKYGSIEFIRVLEPHEDGHAHYHMLIRFDDYKKIYISNSDLNSLWGNGFVTIHSLKDVDNVGAYVSAYFTDIELNQSTGNDLINSSDSNGVIEKDGKKYIKGGRLKYYPTGKQIYNKSKGIKEPVRKTMTYKNAKKIVGSLQPTFEKNILIENDKFSNKIRHESYNSKRV